VPDDVIDARRDTRVDQVDGAAQGAHVVVVPDEVMLLGHLLDIAVQLARIPPQEEHPEANEYQQQYRDIGNALVHGVAPFVIV
jgi:hypothetical protein